MADQRARHLRKTVTPQEVKVWSRLRLRLLRPQGLHFRRQAPLKGYILDFICFHRRLIVEIDGSQHGMGGQIDRDAQRDALFADDGFLTLRFWNIDVDRNLNGVIDTIFARATERPPTRPPKAATLPTRGRDDSEAVSPGGASLPFMGRVASESEPGGEPPQTRAEEF
jgi:very-short-patch-repair endonuclease